MTEARRLIVSDVDGTLLDPTKRISRGTRAAFQRARAQGVTYFALASSRMPASLARIEMALGVPCWKIAYDGVLVEGPANEPIVFELARGINTDEAVRLLTEYPVVYVGAYAGDLWCCNAESKWSAQEATNTEVSPSVTADMLAALEERRDSIHKIMFRDSEVKIAALRSRLEASNLRSARWFSNGPTIIEIVPSAANKALALDFLVTHLGIAPYQVTVFGDGANDIPMFDRFANSVAVENAIPALKSLARYSTNRGDEDGVAKFLSRAAQPAQSKSRATRTIGDNTADPA